MSASFDPSLASASAPLHLIFVYGSLKRGEHNHAHLGRTALFLGEARSVAGYRLFDLGSYPGLVVWPEDRDGVTGELWSIDAPTLAHLDEFEGLAEGLYRREPIRLQPPFADRVAETYAYARSVTAHREIGSTWTGR